MSITVAANLSEGVIFGAESAVTYSTAHGVTNVYDGAQKIFHIGNEDDTFNMPYGGMIFGSATYGNQSWRNVFANFWRSLTARPEDAKKFVDDLVQHLYLLIPDTKNRPVGGLFISGFGPKDKSVRCFKLEMQSLVITENPLGMLLYDGLPHVVQRLVEGIDSKTQNALQNALKGVTINVQDSTTNPPSTKAMPLSDFVLRAIKTTSPRYVPDVNMPLRDGVDYVNFLVYSTVKYFKFAPGAPVCGGDIEIATITLDRGFRRIRTKPLDINLR